MNIAKLNFDDSPVLCVGIMVISLVLFILVVVIVSALIEPYIFSQRDREDDLITKCIEQGQNAVECATVFRQSVD